MLRNFLNTLRHFKMASSLNIIGLSVAFAAFMVIAMQVNYELTFDKFHSKVDRIYKVELETESGEGQAVVPRALINSLGESSPLIESYTQLGPSFGDMYITIEKNGSKVGFKENIETVYPSIADVFDLQMIEGTVASLEEPTKVILPQSKARLYFGDESAMGKLLQVSSDVFWEVGGVYKDFPANSQLNNCIYRKISDGDGRMDDGSGYSWWQSNYFMYVVLAPGATPEQVVADYAKVMDLSEKMPGDSKPHLVMTRLPELYFAQRNYTIEHLIKHGDKATNSIMIAIALLILAIAAINFVNFSTSLAPLRMKSINVQKVLGSLNGELRWRLIVEAAGMCMVSYLVSLLIVYSLSISSFNDITICGISLQENGLLAVLTAGVALLLGLFAGIYPAFYTTKFPPVMALKGSFAMSPRGRMLRTTLIGFQFVVSLVLIISALFLQLQHGYMKSKDTGINKENVVITKLGGDLVGNENFENELRRNSSIQDVTYSQFNIGGENMAQGWGRNLNNKMIQFDAHLVASNFPQVMGLTVVEGEGFKKSDEQLDTFTFMFNQTAVKQYGIKMSDRIEGGQIAGFVKDFNFKSLHYDISPMALVITPPSWTYLPYIYIKTVGDPYEIVDYIRKAAASIDPAYPLDIQFYDQTFNNLYKQELKLTTLITLFSLLAVIISLVGVFGLVVFETQYRRREIGLRRIHGATVGSILLMFNQRFVWIVSSCFVIASPLAYFAVDEWLQGFSYRTPIHWWVFGVALLIVLAITLLTVTIQSWRAATENPIESIK